MGVFREDMKEHDLTASLFERFHENLRALKAELKSGQARARFMPPF